jgi:hypothetical protein
MPVREHFRSQRRLNPHTLCSSTSEAEREFVTLHIVLPLSKRMLNSINEWATYGVFGEMGFSIQ